MKGGCKVLHLKRFFVELKRGCKSGSRWKTTVSEKKEGERRNNEGKVACLFEQKRPKSGVPQKVFHSHQLECGRMASWARLRETGGRFARQKDPSFVFPWKWFADEH